MIFIYLSYHILSYSILCILAEVMATAWPWHGHGMASASRVCCVYLSRVSGWGEARDPGRWLARTSAGAYDRNLEIPGDIWRWKLRKKERKWTETNGNDGYSQSMDLKDLNILYGDLAIKRLLSEHFEILQVTLQNILKSQLYTPRPNLPWSWTCVGCRKSMTSSGAALFDTQLVVTQRCRKL